MKEKKKKIAVVVNQKDICRIIPFNSSDGKYDIKIDFCGNDYNLQLFPLFCKSPKIYYNNDANNLELTYHKDNSGKPPKIHLKRKVNIEGKQKYINLPLENLIAPNVNQILPMPLFKLEIPLTKVNKVYKRKKEHQTLNVTNYNVIEFYLVNKAFNLDELTMKLPAVELALLFTSFETFATNSLQSSIHKIKKIMPDNNEIKDISTSFNLFNDMKIIANHYFDQQLEEKISTINVTFIDNELSEAILAMLRIIYPETSNKGVFDYIYIGPSSIENLNQPFHPILRPSIGESTLIHDSILKGNLNETEKEKFYWFAVNMRKKLLKALKKAQFNSKPEFK